ncbi:MAG: lipid-A-disaccharide synthase [Bacteroidaceae bacterium]
MRYYLIAGEASGDLHASHLMSALRQQDPQAEFRAVGGELMQAQGATLVKHYRNLAYMGFLPVLMHLRTILQGMDECRKDITRWQPDALILVDYPGFNLRIAKYIHTHTHIPVIYYISPKIWAWKEHRIRAIRCHVDMMLCILPFEVDFYERKHHYPVHYVGNPTMDEVDAFLTRHPLTKSTFLKDNSLPHREIIALLPGSRKQEISGNLPRMVQAAMPFTSQYQLVIAAAPGISDDFYYKALEPLQTESHADRPFNIVRNQTYPLLQHSTAALVTSGTATLETALLGVRQIVCYYMWAGRLASLGRKLILKIPFISLVNLVAGKEVVPELVGEQMNVANVQRHLQTLLTDPQAIKNQNDGYRLVAERLGRPGAPIHAARLITARLQEEGMPALPSKKRPARKNRQEIP